jgi:hypothetical protein
MLFGQQFGNRELAKSIILFLEVSDLVGQLLFPSVLLLSPKWLKCLTAFVQMDVRNFLDGLNFVLPIVGY